MEWMLRATALVVVMGAAPVLAQEPAADEAEPHALTTLKQVMPALGLSATRIQEALWRDDFAAVAHEARAIVGHAGFSKQEQERIIGKLGKDTAWFSQADAKVHKSAVEIAEAADKKDAAKVVKALGNMQEGCVACHSNYRARLRVK